MKLSELYFELISEFLACGIEAPEFEAKELIKHIAGLDESGFLLKRNDAVSDEIVKSVITSAKKRKNGEPLQYIIGEWDFLDNRFFVGNGVLIPRPETEILCEFVIDLIKSDVKPVVYDLCSGSGCIGLSVKNAVKSAEVYCIEKSSDAFGYLCKNNKAVCNGEANTINGDIFAFGTYVDLPTADIIVSNPPYIKSDEICALQREVLFEPFMALDGGADGLVFYRFIVAEWGKKLKNNGIFAFECGEDQAKDISNILTGNGFKTKILKDYNNIDRIVIGRR